jgi:RNA polymerase sigma-70 factor (ECF subfamily)
MTETAADHATGRAGRQRHSHRSLHKSDTPRVSQDCARNSRTRRDEEFERDLISLMSFLRAFSHSLCHDRELADELSQDTLCRAWEARASFQPGSNLKAWLFTILRHQFYSHRRRSWRQQAWDEGVESLLPTMENEQNWAAELSDTVRGLNGLSSEQRKALLLVGVGGLAYAEAATVCGCPAGTVKSRVGRGRRELLSKLDGSAHFAAGARPPAGCAAYTIMNAFKTAQERPDVVR